jgi:hypothetical protein
MRQGEIGGSRPADSDRLLLLRELPRSRKSLRATAFRATHPQPRRWNRLRPISKGSSLLDNGMMTRQIMVLESEWKHGVLVSQNAEVDGDFQKLVQARAEVRVWISSSHNPALAQQHLANCKKQVQLFSGSLPGDTYLFIINDWTTPTTRIERFELH